MHSWTFPFRRNPDSSGDSSLNDTTILVLIGQCFSYAYYFVANFVQRTESALLRAAVSDLNRLRSAVITISTSIPFSSIHCDH